jgi:hypothetical protein
VLRSPSGFDNSSEIFIQQLVDGAHVYRLTRECSTSCGTTDVITGSSLDTTHEIVESASSDLSSITGQYGPMKVGDVQQVPAVGGVCEPAVSCTDRAYDAEAAGERAGMDNGGLADVTTNDTRQRAADAGAINLNAVVSTTDSVGGSDTRVADVVNDDVDGLKNPDTYVADVQHHSVTSAASPSSFDVSHEHGVMHSQAQNSAFCLDNRSDAWYAPSVVRDSVENPTVARAVISRENVLADDVRKDTRASDAEQTQSLESSDVGACDHLNEVNIINRLKGVEVAEVEGIEKSSDDIRLQHHIHEDVSENALSHDADAETVELVSFAVSGQRSAETSDVSVSYVCEVSSDVTNEGHPVTAVCKNTEVSSGNTTSECHDDSLSAEEIESSSVCVCAEPDSDVSLKTSSEKYNEDKDDVDEINEVLNYLDESIGFDNIDALVSVETSSPIGRTVQNEQDVLNSVISDKSKTAADTVSELLPGMSVYDEVQQQADIAYSSSELMNLPVCNQEPDLILSVQVCAAVVLKPHASAALKRSSFIRFCLVDGVPTYFRCVMYVTLSFTSFLLGCQLMPCV